MSPSGGVGSPTGVAVSAGVGGGAATAAGGGAAAGAPAGGTKPSAGGIASTAACGSAGAAPPSRAFYERYAKVPFSKKHMKSFTRYSPDDVDRMLLELFGCMAHGAL